MPEPNVNEAAKALEAEAKAKAKVETKPKPPKDKIPLPDVTEGRLSAKGKREVELGRFYSPKELAIKLNVNAKWINNLCKQGRIEAIRVGRLWRIPEHEVLKLWGKGMQAVPPHPPIPKAHEIEVESTRITGKPPVAPEPKALEKKEEKKDEPFTIRIRF